MTERQIQNLSDEQLLRERDITWRMLIRNRGRGVEDAEYLDALDSELERRGIGPLTEEEIIEAVRASRREVRGPGSRTTVEKVHDILAGSYSPAGIDGWWERPRHQLNGRTPAQAVDDGDDELVIAIAEAVRDMSTT